MTTLLIYLEPTGADAAYPWALRSPAGSVLRRGSDPLRAVPQASECVLILPWHRTAVHRVKLPAARRERLQGALLFAIENELLGELAATYAAIGGQDEGGLTTVVSTDRPSLEAVLHGLRERGMPASRLIAEALAVPFAPRSWSVVLRDDGGFVRSGPHGGFSLDLAVAEAPPVQLRLALAEAGSGRAAPEKLRVHRSGAGFALEPWRAALRVAIEDGGMWHWEASDIGTAPDLLQGDLRPRHDRLELLRPWIPAALLAGAMVVVQVAFTLLHWATLSWERASVSREMEAVFRQAVPDAQAVVDPPLQMRRILADLRRASGALAADDFLALLGRTAPEFARVSGSSVRTIEYASGVLRVDLLVPRSEAAAELVQKLAAAGMRAKLESSSASGAGVLARISLGDAAR